MDYLQCRRRRPQPSRLNGVLDECPTKCVGVLAPRRGNHEVVATQSPRVDPQSGDVIVLDAATRKEVKRIQVGGGPVGMVITPDGRRAFVARSQANKVSVIDLDEMKVAGDIEPGQQPDGLAWAK